MALILAIEPNKNQAHQLTALARAHLKAELITAPSAAAGLNALGDRIPDLILTPALFGMRDEAALTERLRELGSAASHVQTLATPILAAATGKSPNGLLGRKNKGDAADGVGCEPSVFAEQIRAYLHRAAAERRAHVGAAAVRSTSVTAAPSPDLPAGPGMLSSDDLSSFLTGDDLDVDSLSLDLPTVPEPTPAAPPPAEPGPETPASSAAAHDESQTRRAARKTKGRSAPSAAEIELGLVTPPAGGPPLWKVAEAIEDFYAGANRFDAQETEAEQRPLHDGAMHAANAAVASSAPPAADQPVAIAPEGSATDPSIALARNTRGAKQPHTDEWAYFDPSQSAFKALIKRLDEIAGSGA